MHDVGMGGEVNERRGNVFVCFEYHLVKFEEKRECVWVPYAHCRVFVCVVN